VGESPFLELADVCAQLAPTDYGDVDTLRELASGMHVDKGGASPTNRISSSLRGSQSSSAIPNM
jgi:hypothetical protein